LYILFIFGECLLVVHLLASLVNSIHRNLLRQVAKLPSIVQHTVSVVAIVGGFVVTVVGLVRVTVVGLVRVTVVGGFVVAVVVGGFVVGVVVGGFVVAVVVGGFVVAVVVGGFVVAVVVDGFVVAVVVGGFVVAVVAVVVVTPGSHAILVTGIFEGVVQHRRSVEIIISLVGVCLIIHLVY